MKKYKTQICLVSGQSIPNITPVLDGTIRPGKVILCTSNAMQGNAETLKVFLISKQIDTEIYKLGDAYDFKELKEKFLALALACGSDESFAVNLTCGNKLMTIAAQEVFAGECDLFYVIPERDQIIMVSDENASPYEIEDKLKLEEFFAIHGYKIKNIERCRNISGESKKLFEELLPRMDQCSGALGTLNHLAADAKRKRTLQINNDIPEKSWNLLKIFQDHGSIAYYDDKKIEFKNEISREFCNGFWFEDYIYLEMKKLYDKLGLQDFAVSVEIENKHGVKNEIDAAFIQNNSLYLIECKTSKMDIKEKGSNVVYKMDTITNYAGLYTKGVLISYRKLNTYDYQRAKDLKITVIHGNEINNIEKRLPVKMTQ